MREIMKKSMLLVIFSFVITFGASLAFADVDDPVTSGDSAYENDWDGYDVYGDPLGEENDGDPDGYKEGWDNDFHSESGIVGLGSGVLSWDQIFYLWVMMQNQSSF